MKWLIGIFLVSCFLVWCCALLEAFSTNDPVPATVTPVSRTYTNCTVRIHWTMGVNSRKTEVHVYTVSLNGTNRSVPSKELVFTSP